MKLAPSHLGGLPPKPPAFVGRDRELDILKSAVERQQMPDEYRVASVYGVGGQGKSSLLEQFQSWMAAQSWIIPVARLDLASSTHREPLTGLLSIRNQLHSFGFDASTFDFAFARYYKLTWPMRKLREDFPEFFGRHEGLIGDLAEIAGVTAAEFPGGKLIYEVLSKLSESCKEWYQRSQSIVSNIEDLSAREILDLLPTYLGYDLSSCIERDPSYRPVILMDSFETLWQQHGGLGSSLGTSIPDAWLRLLAEETPGVLFVVAGRQRIHWADTNAAWDSVTVECCLSDLSPEEQTSFLVAEGVAEPDIRSHIIQHSQGHALSLVLQTRIYKRLAGTGALSVADFPTTQKDILDRFTSHLEASMASVLRALAIGQDCDETLWHRIQPSLLPGTPYSFFEITRDVLFRRTEEQRYAMHEVLREHLIADMADHDPWLLKRIRLAHFEYHDEASAARPPDPVGEAKATQQKPGVLTQDRHLLEAAGLLLQAEAARFPSWCLGRLLQYRETGGRSKVHRVLVQKILEAHGEGRTLSAEEFRMLARLEVLNNPFSRNSEELARRLLKQVEDSTESPTGTPKSDLDVAFHLALAGKHELARSVCKPRRASECDEANLREHLILSTLCRDWENAEELLWSVMRTCNPEKQFFAEMVAVAARSADPGLLPAVLSFAAARPPKTRLSDLASVLDNLILEGNEQHLSQVLEALVGTADVMQVRQFAFGPDSSSSGRRIALPLLADCLAASGRGEEASLLLQSLLPPDAVERVHRMWDRLDHAKMSRFDLNKAINQALATDKNDTTEYSVLFCKFIQAEFDLGKDMPERAALQQVVDAMKRIEVVYEIRLGATTLCGPLLPRDAQVELVVNDRYEAVIFVNDPLFCDHIHDFIGIVDEQLFFHDRRLGLQYFGLEVDERLMKYLAPGYPLLLVWMDEGSGRPFGSTYTHLYDWKDAIVTTKRREDLLTTSFPSA